MLEISGGNSEWRLHMLSRRYLIDPINSASSSMGDTTPLARNEANHKIEPTMGKRPRIPQTTLYNDTIQTPEDHPLVCYSSPSYPKSIHIGNKSIFTHPLVFS